MARRLAISLKASMEIIAAMVAHASSIGKVDLAKWRFVRELGLRTAQVVLVQKMSR